MADVTTTPQVTIETREMPSGTWYQARCARGHTGGWLPSAEQAVRWLWVRSCSACRGPVEAR